MAKNDIISIRGMNDKQTTPYSSVYIRDDEGCLIRATRFLK